MRLAMYLKKPRFEVLTFPEEELDYWASYFSLQEGDVPQDNIPTEGQATQTQIDNSIAGFEKIFG